MFELNEGLLSAVSDLFKYEVNSKFNTGDKYKDQLLITFATIFIGICVAYIKNNLNEYLNNLHFFNKINVDKEGFVINPSLETKLYLNSCHYGWPFHKLEKKEIYSWLIKKYPNSSFALYSYSIDEKGENIIKSRFNDFLFEQGTPEKPTFIIINKEKEFYTVLTYNGTFMICVYTDKSYTYFNQNTQNLYNCIIRLLNLVQESSCEIEKTEENCLYDYIDNNFVSLCKIQPKRTLDSLVFNQKKDLLSYIHKFQSNVVKNNVYGNKNFGLLLYGPGGTGKSSIVKALSNYFNRSVVVLNIQKIKTQDAFIKAYRDCVSNKYIIVFDEFDLLLENLGKELKDDSISQFEFLNKINLCEDREVKKQLTSSLIKNFTDSKEPVNLQTLLTQFDGIHEDVNRIMIATTNHPENIPSNLLRPGRFDFKLHLDKFVNNEIIELLCKIYDVGDDDLNWLNKQTFIEKKWSPAEIINKSMIYNLRDLVSYLQTEDKEIFTL